MNLRSSGDHLENPRMSPEFSREHADSAEYDEDLDDFQDASRNRHTKNVELTLIEGPKNKTCPICKEVFQEVNLLKKHQKSKKGCQNVACMDDSHPVRHHVSRAFMIFEEAKQYLALLCPTHDYKSHHDKRFEQQIQMVCKNNRRKHIMCTAKGRIKR